MVYRPRFLVLLCDFSADGTALGPVSIERLLFALEYVSEEGGGLAVAAGYSPRPWHAAQPASMAEMAAEWLGKRGYTDVKVLQSKYTNTLGELKVFLPLPDAAGVISDAQHLERAMVLARKIDPVRGANLLPIPLPGTDGLTKKGRQLERIKRWYALLPLWLQDGVTFLLHRTPLRRIQLSY